MTIYREEKLSDAPLIRERIEELRTGGSVTPAPRVSVVIPAYKVADFVAETLDSVFAQTFPGFEVIVVNDGSPDSELLETALAPYSDRIVYVRQANGGASRARNLGIVLARGEWIAFLDGDDIWYPEYLARQMEYAVSNSLDMCYTDSLLFGDTHYDGANFMQSAPSEGPVTTVSLIASRCNVITSGTVLRRARLEATGLFDPALRGMEDFDLWFRVARSGAPIGYQKRVLTKYRVRSDSLSGTNVERAERSVRAMEVIAEKYELDAPEREAIAERLEIYRAVCELERGKYALVSGEYRAAAEAIAKANRYFRKPKLALTAAMIRIAPGLARRMFRNLRSSEYSFIEKHR
jgi:glycosyltransferase involved in cell wall biosynthesis